MKKTIILLGIAVCIAIISILCAFNNFSNTTSFETLSASDTQNIYEKYISATEAFESQNDIVMIYGNTYNFGYTSQVNFRMLLDKHRNMYIIYGWRGEQDKCVPEYAVKRKLSIFDYQYLISSAQTACKELSEVPNKVDGIQINAVPQVEVEIFYKDNHFVYDRDILNDAYYRNDIWVEADSKDGLLQLYKCRELQEYARGIYQKYDDDKLTEKQ